MNQEYEGGIGQAQPGQYAPPIKGVNMAGWYPHAMRLASEDIRQRSERKPSKRTLRQRITSRIWIIRGRIAEWIAPEGWFD